MKLKELLSKLETFDPEVDVLCYSEDADLLPKNHGFRIFDIIALASKDAEKSRTGDGIPSLKLGKSGHSSTHVLIELTSDF